MPQKESPTSLTALGLCSLCILRAEEEDRKMAESWRGNADGIIFFVSAYVPSVHYLVTQKITDWSFLRRSRDIASGLHSDPPLELSGPFSPLPRADLSAPLQWKWIPGHHPFVVIQPRCFVHQCHHSDVSCLGQLTFFLEFDHQSHLRLAGNNAATVDATLSQTHQPTVQSTQAGADPRILCPWRREAAPSLGGRSVTNASSRLSFPFLCWPMRISVWYPPDHLHRCGRVGWAMRCNIRICHRIADHPQGQPLPCTAFYIHLVLCWRCAMRYLRQSPSPRSHHAWTVLHS